MAEPGDWVDADDDWEDVPDGAEGEPGQPGHDPYKAGATAHQPTEPLMYPGTFKDAAKTWANTAALGAGPQISGVMGAIANAATDPMQIRGKDIDAYRDVRDDTARDLASSENTSAGQMAKPLGVVSTPIPVKALPYGASGGAKIWQGAKIGGGAGFVHGAATSKGDILKGEWEQIIRDALMQGVPGAAGGAVAGPLFGVTEKPLRSVAETQALRAAGLRGGIKNSIRKDLGVPNMTEARKLGRQFLDEDLIPPVGSAEAVAKRAEALQGESGNVIGSTMTRADLSGAKANEAAVAQAVRKVLAGETRVAQGAGAKTRKLARQFEDQALDTPGSFTSINKAKSDAWKSANFTADPDMSALLYRKGVGSARDEIEKQIGQALGPDDAAALRSANERYGVGADALKLAENAATRDAAKKGFGMPEILAMTTGAGAAGGSAMGHGAEGALGGLGLALGAKGFDKYGHSTAARLSDYAAKRAAPTGALVGSAGAGALTPKAIDALAPYLELLKGDADE